ncbi:hypothetical protein D3C83_40380 [compost metagenome]
MFSSDTIPEAPPYSSRITAMCVFCSMNCESSDSTVLFSGTNRISRLSSSRLRPGPRNCASRRSFTWIRPMV